MQSMTGFGRGTAPLGEGTLVVEARAVNHRFLDVRVRFPSSLAEAASIAEAFARKQMQRGRIEVTARTEGSVAGTVVLDRARARAAFETLTELRDELQPDAQVPLSLLSAVPDLFASTTSVAADDTRTAVETAVADACRNLKAMRRHEGEALRTDLTARAQSVRDTTALIAPLAEQVRSQHREKFLARIERLLADSQTETDQARLEHEIALQADRGDISEELTRLVSHCDQFDGLLAETDEPVGRRLEFLLQEMGREVNTTGAKVTDLALTRHVLALKAELERMREQVQNVL